jgi:acyl-CoA synthetase (AMP-forming)/AMP-acid ligase II
MNISLLLDMAADGFGDRVIVGRREAGLTATQLLERSYRGAAAIREAEADAVLYFAVNGPAFPVALFAAARAGVPLVPVNYRLGQEQLDALLSNHPKAFGIADVEQNALRRHDISCRTPEDWLAQTAEGNVDRSLLGEDYRPAAIIYTSGTTSAPKGVVLRHENLSSYVMQTIEFAGAPEDEAGLTSVPPYHIAGVANVLSSVFSGRRSIVLEAFQPAAWLSLVREEQITHAMVVPTMLARIMAEETDRSVPSLRLLSYGGAKMPLRVIERALTEWPHVDFCNAYGLTETSSTLSVLGPDDHRAALTSDDPKVRARLASAGQVVPGIELEVRDVFDELVRPGVTGRIWVRGDQVSGEYSGTGPTIDERGFFDTRDQGYVDEDGYLFVEGRADDTIIRGAENIAPAEIEDVLLRYPGISDAVVVGVPDDEWGQRIEAAVVSDPGATVDPEAVRAHVRRQLRGSKTPDRVVVWSELPRTETGKIVRRIAVQQLVSRGTAQP